MEPCRVCGAVTVTAAGYCTGCGTFRGQPAPVSGTPYPGPTSAPPTSGPPVGYPVTGYPAPYPPPGPVPPHRRSPYLVPLVALSTVLVLLVVAIVAVIVVRSGGGSTGAAGSPTPAATTSALIDSCLVGTWRSTTDAEQLDIDGVGQVTVTGQGMVVHIRPDGSTYQDYGQSSPYEGTANDHSLSISVTGSIRATIRTDSGTMSFQNVQAQGTVTAKVDGTAVTSVPLVADSDPVRYTCAGDTAAEHAASYDISLTRVSHTP